MKITLEVRDLGIIDYQECLSVQRELTRRRLEGEIEDTLLLLEHTPVITLGTAGGESSLLASPDVLANAGVKVCRTDRGGNITYHGPGQLVGYPIFDLRLHGKDIHLLLRNIEQVVIDSLSDFGIRSERRPGFTGVWVGEEKICSIGMAVRKWISYHGFALNVSPNYDHWALIHPCGLVDRQVTSIEKLVGESVDMATVKEFVTARTATVFGMDSVVSVNHDY